jgi:uncharacterized protein YbgA (DUF1722 family)
MTVHDKQWNMQYEQLLEYKRKKGNCMVPRKHEQDKSLGIWVSRQRGLHKNNEIRLDRKELLDQVGFAWNPDRYYNFKPDDKLWHQQYKKLLEFKRMNVHCRVPHSYEQDKSLGEWVSTQRQYHKDKKLRLDRKELLDEIGFVWKNEELESQWNQQHEKLVEFKRKNGHCMVPQSYEQDKSLGEWVSKQRKVHNKNKMRPDRKERLDQIGFAWNARARVVRSPTSTNDVRVLHSSLDHFTFWKGHVAHSPSFSSILRGRIWMRKRSSAV